MADEEGFVASATIYDTAGKAAIATLPVRLAPAPDKLGAYEPGVAVFTWSTFTMSGLVANQHPEAGGYPYTRTRYESSPLAREVQRGIPGADFAIVGAAGNTHTTSIRYGINDTKLGLTPGRYFTETLVDPDGITRVTLTDQRGAIVRVGALAARAPERWDVTIYIRDVALNLVSLVTPMGYRVESTYDFLNAALTQASANMALSRRMYDLVGRLRFEMTGDGVATVPQYVRFYKYDRQSRIERQGSFVHAWDSELSQRVDDQTWPPATPSDVFQYDGLDRMDLLGVRYLTATTSEHQVSGAREDDFFRSHQQFFYDERGRTERTSARADAFKEATYDLIQRYNNLEGVVGINTPSFEGGHAERIEKHYDLVGRIRLVALDGAPLVRYEYDLSGQVSRETWWRDNVSAGGRTLEYNPPGWNTLIDGTGFQERTYYTSGGARGAGYFNGSPAHAVTARRGSKAEIVSRYAYDLLGRLDQATVESEAATYGYDANGNITELGNKILTYQGSDQVKTAAESGQSTSYEYDNDGNLKHASGGADLGLAFDWFRGLPLRVSRTVGGETVDVELRYGFRGRRIFRKVARIGAPDSSVLYLRGDSPDTVVEFASDGRKTIHIEGLRGLAALRIDGQTYFVSTDRLGSVRALVDSFGSLVAGYDLGPYGSPLGAPLGQGDLTSYRFTGRQLDPSGLYDFRARLYDAGLGRIHFAQFEAAVPEPILVCGGQPPSHFGSERRVHPIHHCGGGLGDHRGRENDRNSGGDRRCGRCVGRRGSGGGHHRRKWADWRTSGRCLLWVRGSRRRGRRHHGSGVRRSGRGSHHDSGLGDGRLNRRRDSRDGDRFGHRGGAGSSGGCRPKRWRSIWRVGRRHFWGGRFFPWRFRQARLGAGERRGAEHVEGRQRRGRGCVRQFAEFGGARKGRSWCPACDVQGRRFRRGGKITGIKSSHVT